MTTFVNMLILRRFVTAITCARARGGSRHGMKIDVPFLNARQLISYLTPSTSIGLFRSADEFLHVDEAARRGVEHEAVDPRCNNLHAL